MIFVVKHPQKNHEVIPRSAEFAIQSYLNNSLLLLVGPVEIFTLQVYRDMAIGLLR